MEKNQKKTKSTGLHKALADLIKKHTIKPSEIEIGEGADKLTIKVDPMAPAGVRASAIIQAADLVFNGTDDGVDGYMPAFLQFAHRFGVMICFTDFDMPEDLGYAWFVLNNTPIYDKVTEIVGEEFVREFAHQLDELIEVRKQERIHMINFNRLLNKVENIIDGFSKKFEGFDMKETLKLFENLPNKLGGLPKGLGLGSMGGLENIIKTLVDASGNLKSDKGGSVK